MARNAKLTNSLQVFRGSRTQQDVFTANAGTGCCPSGATEYDKLAERTRFDNALAHSNPTGANDKFKIPYGNGFSGNRTQIIDHINKHGVGAHISVLAIPTYAFVTGVGIHIEAEEPGLTFDLVTRNGLVIPGTAAGQTVDVIDNAADVIGSVTLPASGSVLVVETQADGCEVTRALTEGTASAIHGFGALGSNTAVDIFCHDGDGQFSLEADEIALRVASMPSSGKVVGDFSITVSVSYDIIHRAEN